MPRKPAVKNYYNTDQYPPIFLIHIKRTSKSRVVQHRESFWEKKARVAWGKLDKTPRKKWMDKQNTMTNMLRCTAGPTWLSKNCPEGGDLQAAKKYYQQHKKKGECLTRAQFKAFGCKKDALNDYEPIRAKSYERQMNRIQNTMKKVKTPKPFSVAKQWLLHYRDKLTVKNLKEEDFWQRFDGWVESSEALQVAVRLLDKDGKYTDEKRKWYENFHMFVELLSSIMDQFVEDGREFSDYKIFAQTLPLIRGYPEKNPNAQKKVNDFLEKIIILKKRRPLKPKIPSRMGVFPPSKKSCSSTSISLKKKITPKSKPTPPPKKKTPPPRNAATYKAGKLLPLINPAASAKSSIDLSLPTIQDLQQLSDKERMNYLGSYYLYTQHVFESITKTSKEEIFDASREKLATSLHFWNRVKAANLLDEPIAFYQPIRNDIDYWWRVINNFYKIRFVLEMSHNRRDDFDEDWPTQQNLFRLLIRSDRNMNLKTANSKQVNDIVDLVMRMMDEKKKKK